jgi:hypothetical protein
VTYIAIGLRGGAALVFAALAIVGSDAALGAGQTWWLAATAATVFLFLLELEGARGNQTIRHSMKVLLRGSMAGLFFGVVVVIGFVIPLALVLAAYGADIGAAGLLVAGIASLAGDLAYKQCMNAAGTYAPLMRASY